jgi:hypothetical protein
MYIVLILQWIKIQNKCQIVLKRAETRSSNHFQWHSLSHPCYAVTVSDLLLYFRQVTGGILDKIKQKIISVHLLYSEYNDCRITYCI